MFQPAAVPEREEGEAPTPDKGICLNALDPVPNILSELVWTIAKVAYIALIVVEQKDNLAQLLAAGERTRSELLGAAGDNQLLYLALTEPHVANLLDPVREPQHPRAALEPDAFWRPRVWQRLGTDARIPETKKAELLDVLAQL